MAGLESSGYSGGGASALAPYLMAAMWGRGGGGGGNSITSGMQARATARTAGRQVRKNLTHGVNESARHIDELQARGLNPTSQQFAGIMDTQFKPMSAAQYVAYQGRQAAPAAPAAPAAAPVSPAAAPAGSAIGPGIFAPLAATPASAALAANQQPIGATDTEPTVAAKLARFAGKTARSAWDSNIATRLRVGARIAGPQAVTAGKEIASAAGQRIVAGAGAAGRGLAAAGRFAANAPFDAMIRIGQNVQQTNAERAADFREAGQALGQAARGAGQAIGRAGATAALAGSLMRGPQQTGSSPVASPAPTATYSAVSQPAQQSPSPMQFNIG